MWYLQKFNKSQSIVELSMNDHSDPEQSYLYQLSLKQVSSMQQGPELVQAHHTLQLHPGQVRPI